MGAIPLAQFEVVNTTQPDEAHEAACSTFTRHKLNLESNINSFHSHICNADLDDISLAFVDYGSPVVIEPGELEDFYLLQIPLSGSADIYAGCSRCMTSPKTGSIISPNQNFKMDWSADCSFLSVKINQKAVKRKLSDLLEDPVDQTVMFDVAMDLNAPHLTSLLHQVKFLKHEVETAFDFLSKNYMKKSYEDMLITGLLLSQPHQYTHLLEASKPGISPKHVKRAIDYLQQNLHEKITMQDLSNAAGVTARTLQNSFKEFKGISPMQYLCSKRLSCIHDELRKPNCNKTVTEIAEMYGITHFGRFAKVYKERYGHHPSKTLKMYQ